MSRDPNVLPASPESSRASAIENQIPAYRAISPHAVFSFLFGSSNGSTEGNGNGHKNGNGSATAIIPQTQEERIRVARQKGYEGDPCTECGQLTMVRSGACAKCDTCGATSGCS